MTDSPSLKSFLRPTPLIAIAWSVFQLYAVLIGFLHPLLTYPIHVTFAVALVFLRHPISKGREDWSFLRILLVLYTFVIGGYLILNFERFSTRIPFVDSPTGMDILLGISLVVLLLEACRRIVGLTLTVLAAVFIAYGFAGQYAPGLLAHRGLSVERFVDLQVPVSQRDLRVARRGIGRAGLLLYPLRCLSGGRGGELFTDLAYSATGRVRGGAAKASVVSSALYGTISGSAVANVVITGQFTIPLMKKSGNTPVFAGSVEAVASTGGQIMPPVMGAAAFILAQIVGVSYWEVAIAAAIPACMYYVALFFAIDFEAVKRGAQGTH